MILGVVSGTYIFVCLFFDFSDREVVLSGSYVFYFHCENNDLVYVIKTFLSKKLPSCDILHRSVCTVGGYGLCGFVDHLVPNQGFHRCTDLSNLLESRPSNTATLTTHS